MIDKVHENIQKLLELADKINSLAEEYFLSMNIIYVPPPFNVISPPESHYQWGKLTEEVHSKSEELTEKYNFWVSASRMFVKKYSSESEDEFYSISTEIRKLIDRSNPPRCSKNIDVFRRFKSSFSIQKNILSSIDFAFKNGFYSETENARPLIEINNSSRAEVGDISIDVKNEIIVQFIKPVLDDKILKLKDFIKEIEIENKKEIINTCDEILSIENPSSSLLKKKGQKLLDLCKVKSENLEKTSTILQIISAILSILN